MTFPSTNVYNLSLCRVEVTSGDERMTSEVTELKLCNRPLSNLIEILGRPWTIQLILTLGSVTSILRYSEIKKHLDKKNEVEISDATLSRKLTDLTNIGILLRQSFDESPPRVEYRLTQTGIQLYEKLCDLSNWAREECHSGGLNITKSY
jgi:DNA-binding HxlR family transcriptional regulator